MLYNAIISQSRNDHQYVLPRPVWANQDIEKWWDTLIKTAPTVPHNKPDIVVCKKNENKCFIIDICVPLDENVHKQEKMKIDNYTLLTVGLHRLYPNYSYEVVPIVIIYYLFIIYLLFIYLFTLCFTSAFTFSHIINGLFMPNHQ